MTPPSLSELVYSPILIVFGAQVLAVAKQLLGEGTIADTDSTGGVYAIMPY
eukprot:SAG31_NODE_28687_length_406_cov_1.228013_1_plen_50_part_10